MLKFNNKVLKINGNWLNPSGSPVPPVPVLPDNTIRLKYAEGVTPTFSKGTAVQVSSSPNVWDLTCNDWCSLLQGHTNLLEVIAANSSNITSMGYMFDGCNSLNKVALFDTSNVINMNGMFKSCSSLQEVPLFDTSNVINMNGMFNYCRTLSIVPLFNTSKVTDMSLMFHNCYALTTVPLFNTSNVTNMDSMFQHCDALTSVPLFDTSKVTDMDLMFEWCTHVQSGALALYQQASTQTTIPTNHNRTFHDCGSNTSSGSAELEQIPSDWQ